ncbi:MAG: DNA polymerase III subunit gamma/tau [Candidatus Pacebacteria bacterium]|nr:DNA polymerase III subunit gamma/tau [Candidatus Paceibacterota bacterium]
MSEVLYRKYRPGTFKEVIGQDKVVDAIKGAIDAGKISHAYLFSGSRGTGKTSVARIFAKELKVHESDIYEIDAASNTGVDDIRDLKESVSTLPFESEYKFYIIDEVHMLSKAAFNAFLKTLEEPPKHVIFILATTEIEKLPDTIVSRCQVHNFKKPNQKILRTLVLNVSKKEGYSIENSSADLIALLGDGSFRDTLGILQKVISSSGDKKISVEEVEAITGAPRGVLVHEYIRGLVEKDVEKGMEAVRDAGKANVDMKVFFKLILQKMRFLLLLRYAPKMKSTVENNVSEDDFSFLLEIAENKNFTYNSETLLVLLKAYDDMRVSFMEELPLELALVKVSEES